MFCTSCGKQVADNADTCAYCGNRLNVSVYTPNYRYYEYKRLGGFLLFIVVMGYIGLAYTIISTIAANYSLFSRMDAFKQVLGEDTSRAMSLDMLVYDALVFISCVLIFIILKSIREGDDSFLKEFQTLYIFEVVEYTLLYIIGYALLGDYANYVNFLLQRERNYLLSWFITAMGITIIFIIWNAYFTRSVRVCVYMGSDRYLRNSIFNKDTCPPIDIRNMNNQMSDSLSYISPIHKEKNVYENDSYDNNGSSDWKCPNCNRLNSFYVGTCACGRPKNGYKKPVAEEKKEEKTELQKTENTAEQVQSKASDAVSESESIERIKKYKELLDSGIITQEEFNKKKEKFLDL